jgi:hypothetical protein
MKVTIFTALFVLFLSLSHAYAKKNFCGDIEEGAAITKGKKMWNKSFMWSDPKSKQFDHKYCRNKCKKNSKCKGWNYRSSRFGAGCTLYSKVGVNGFKYDYQCMCSTYAGTCNYKN